MNLEPKPTGWKIDQLTREGKGMNTSSLRHAIQGTTALRAAEWIPMTAARILIGVFFCISGGTKLLVPAQFRLMDRTMVESHIPFPHFNAVFVPLVEFICGGCLALGLLTPVCASMLVCVMVVAIATNRIQSIQSSGVLPWLDDFLYLPEVLYVIILVWLIFSGPGRYSIDGRFLSASQTEKQTSDEK
jgi:putative oxidoreductase